MPTTIEQSIVDYVLKTIPNNRIICLVAYGSSLSDSAIPPKDFDFILLLKSFDPQDFLFVKDIKIKFPCDFFIDYQDQIERKGLKNYQRGRHGSYFVAVLAHARNLIGDNIYAKYLPLIPRHKIKSDLLFRIEEYFYRIQKIYTSQSDAQAIIDNDIIKYICRICIDLLLFHDELTFKDMHKYHYLEITKKLIKTSKIFSNSASRIEAFIYKKSSDSISDVVGILYEIYLQAFDVHQQTALQLNNKQQ